MIWLWCLPSDAKIICPEDVEHNERMASNLVPFLKPCVLRQPPASYVGIVTKSRTGLVRGLMPPGVCILVAAAAKAVHSLPEDLASLSRVVISLSSMAREEAIVACTQQCCEVLYDPRAAQ